MLEKEKGPPLVACTYIDGGKIKCSQKTNLMCNSMSTNDIITKVGIFDSMCQGHTFELVMYALTTKCWV